MVEALRAEVAQLRADAASVETEARTQRQTARRGRGDGGARGVGDHGRSWRRIEADSQDEAQRSQAFLDAQVELAALAGRIDTVESDLVRNQSDEAEAQERIRIGEERLETLRARLEEGAAERRRLDARAEAVRDRARRDRGRRSGRGGDGARARGGGRASGGATCGCPRPISIARARAVQEHAIRLAELRVRRQDLEADARRRFEVDLEALRLTHDPERDMGEARARLEAVAQRISALEPVNLIADEEYRELDERLGFLRTQHDDLSSSMRDLDEGPPRDDANRAGAVHARRSRRSTGTSRSLFTRLFEGGRAELRLVEAPEGGDPLETGIEMVAQPRGKRLQAISLLSGGEKALTGLALLFAIFYYRPSPFCSSTRWMRRSTTRTSTGSRGSSASCRARPSSS